MNDIKILTRIVNEAEIHRAHHLAGCLGPFFSNRWHVHNEYYHLSLLLAGRAVFCIGRRHYTIEPGQAVFINAGERHRSLAASESRRMESFHVMFQLKTRRHIPLNPVIIAGSHGELISVLHSLVSEFHMKRGYRQELMRAHLLNALILLFRMQGHGKRLELLSKRQYRQGQTCVSIQGKIDQAVRFIHDHYAEKIRLRDIAKTVSWSPSSLTHNFKKGAGCSPTEYLIGYRLSQGLSLMQKTDQKLSVVAAQVGFGDEYYFSKMFRKKYRLPPRLYMASVCKDVK